MFHASLLKPFIDGGRGCVPLPPIEIQGELEYEVECILDKRMVTKRGRKKTSKGKKVGQPALQPQYLIKWLNWGHEHNTW